jgi:hypothetical protein
MDFGNRTRGEKIKASPRDTGTGHIVIESIVLHSIYTILKVESESKESRKRDCRGTGERNAALEAFTGAPLRIPAPPPRRSRRIPPLHLDVCPANQNVSLSYVSVLRNAPLLVEIQGQVMLNVGSCLMNYHQVAGLLCTVKWLKQV